jgi:hypothetical protein
MNLDEFSDKQIEVWICKCVSPLLILRLVGYDQLQRIFDCVDDTYCAQVHEEQKEWFVVINSGK